MDSLLYLAIVPVVVLLFYIYKKDKNKEPGRLLGKVFFLGMISFIPILIFELVLGKFFNTEDSSNLFTLFIGIFVSIALVEELFKWLVVKKYGYDNDHFDESFDAIVYSVYASLGFACLENILYVLFNGFTVGILRAFTAVPGHACDAVVMGYFLGKAKSYEVNNEHSKANLYLIISFIFPTITHGFYDFLLSADIGIYMIIWLVTTIIFFVFCIILINKLSKNNQLFNKNLESNNSVSNNEVINNTVSNELKRNYCVYCGQQIDGANFCTHCGAKNE